MVQNQPQPSLEELAVKAKEAAIRAKDDLLSSEAKQQALLEKQIALTELMSVLAERITTEIPKPRNSNMSEYSYEEFIQELWLHICKKIHTFDPNKGSFMAWIFIKVKYLKINAFNWLNWNKPNCDAKIVSIYQDGDESERNILDTYEPTDINPFLIPSEELVDFRELIVFIKEDPEGLLASKLFKKNPKASFQVIALKKCEEEKTWQEIVQELELGNTHGPVYQFYRRCCEEFLPYFKKYLCE